MSATALFLGGRVAVHHGDSREVLKGFPDGHFHAVVCDPPYALVSIVKRFGGKDAAPARDGDVYARASAGFMGQTWDTGETAFAAEFWREVLRVLKPGGWVLAASGTRTYHRLAVAIEDAGFEIRDMVSWLYGTGFPKSHDVGKGIDKLDASTVRRQRQLRFTSWMRSTEITSEQINFLTNTVMASHYLTDKQQPLVATRQHFEAMRPLLGDVPEWVERLVDERTVESENFKARQIVGLHKKQAQAAEWREKYAGETAEPAGAITVAHTPEAAAWKGWGTALKPACEPWVLARKPLVGTVAKNVLTHGTGALNLGGCKISDDGLSEFIAELGFTDDGGRWPANVLHDGSDEVIAAFPQTSSGEGAVKRASAAGSQGNAYGKESRPAGTVMASYGDAGSAARFFFSAKADDEDRFGSKHPTVKPVDLMQYLVRLVTPPGGTVLDPFAGTGTTGEAAWREGFSAVLIEREAAFIEDIHRRLTYAASGPDERRHARVKASGKAVAHGDLPLFGERGG